MYIPFVRSYDEVEYENRLSKFTTLLSADRVASDAVPMHSRCGCSDIWPESTVVDQTY